MSLSKMTKCVEKSSFHAKKPSRTFDFSANGAPFAEIYDHYGKTYQKTKIHRTERQTGALDRASASGGSESPHRSLGYDDRHSSRASNAAYARQLPRWLESDSALRRRNGGGASGDRESQPLDLPITVGEVEGEQIAGPNDAWWRGPWRQRIRTRCHAQ